MTEEEKKLALDYSYKVEPFMDVGIDNSISVYCREDVEQAYLDGYLAGLKAGKNMNVPTKWHKVVDGDLPSEEGGWVCNQDGLPCYFDWGTEQWLDCEGTQIRTTEWCYMPHKE